MLKLTITAATSNETLEQEIPFIDMREHAAEMRDMAAAVTEEQGDQVVLELHDIDGVTVLYSPAFSYAYVNEMSVGVGNSLLIGNGEADSPEHAAQQWAENVAEDDWGVKTDKLKDSAQGLIEILEDLIETAGGVDHAKLSASCRLVCDSLAAAHSAWERLYAMTMTHTATGRNE